ncbi:hypothetical protein G4170_14795 [Vibrio parahaemolyticus]|uniref:hypothetical protein n=1 Tax=Vibrio parahaemolyticus TaxID=670 RepID=UPI00177D4813|nr:hypothetical protein [Vibrio parahaemolyticus]EGR2700586.1 hypothetical protein [Vibrio parahaemolyticus]MBD6967805.1 hypothetical protein [Vibrio parahaemolyticus]MBD6971990.1 hypothetical protein [Vibrio parahaemolyticus]
MLNEKALFEATKAIYEAELKHKSADTWESLDKDEQSEYIDMTSACVRGFLTSSNLAKCVIAQYEGRQFVHFNELALEDGAKKLHHVFLSWCNCVNPIEWDDEKEETKAHFIKHAKVIIDKYTSSQELSKEAISQYLKGAGHE